MVRVRVRVRAMVRVRVSGTPGKQRTIVGVGERRAGGELLQLRRWDEPAVNCCAAAVGQEGSCCRCTGGTGGELLQLRRWDQADPGSGGSSV
jgi:hypothetical protein